MDAPQKQTYMTQENDIACKSKDISHPAAFIAIMIREYIFNFLHLLPYLPMCIHFPISNLYRTTWHIILIRKYFDWGDEMRFESKSHLICMCKVSLLTSNKINIITFCSCLRISMSVFFAVKMQKKKHKRNNIISLVN